MKRNSFIGKKSTLKIASNRQVFADNGKKLNSLDNILYVFILNLNNRGWVKTLYLCGFWEVCLCFVPPCCVEGKGYYLIFFFSAVNRQFFVGTARCQCFIPPYRAEYSKNQRTYYRYRTYHNPFANNYIPKLFHKKHPFST